MARSLIRSGLALALVMFASVAALAQSSSTSITGIVVDTGGGVLPGANVVVKNNANATTYEAVSNSAGAFTVPSLDPGTYTVTVSLNGFKTAVVNEVRLLASRPGEIKVSLEVGALTETVEVKAASELVQTQSSTVTSTITTEQINNLPLVSRNALYFTVFLPGVETLGGPRGSTIMGLPQNTINITIDGISNSNNFQSGDGFFSLVTPRTDAVEEITVTGATPGANNAGAGAVNIAFVTRSGTNRFDTSLYHYFRHPKLNTNYFFNEVNGLDKNEVIVHQYGGRIGGPIVIPGLFDGRNKAFFFFNMEHFHQPTEATRNRTILSPAAEQGIFTYNAGGTFRTVNLLTLAAANGQTTTLDPIVSSLLGKIRAATATTGSLVTPDGFINTQRYVYQTPGTRNEYAPTGRVDINLSDAHRLTGTYYWQRFISDPDILNGAEIQFPGFTNYGIQASYRTTGSVGVRSTLGANLVNEIKGGWQWSPVDFFGNVTRDMFENQGFFNLDFDNNANNTEFTNLHSITAASNPQPRNTDNWNIDNTLSWIKGSHSLSVGATFAQITHDQNSSNLVPSITFGVDTNNDPARLMFTNTNIPGASNAQLALARHMYALLTGRVTQVGGTARLNESLEYIYLGNLNSRSRMREFGTFIQDSWRVTPALTLNAGVRWELQLPFTPLSNTWSNVTTQSACGVSGEGAGFGGRFCNLFQPGHFGAPGLVPEYVKYDPGSPGFNTDYNNFAPNVGVAWRPNVEDGFMRRLLGDPEQATVRGGYSIAFNRERMDRFTGLYGGNVGGTLNANRNNTTGFPLVRPGESWPLLYRETNRLGPPAFPPRVEYPILASIGAGNDLNMFDPNIETPYTESWMVGFQRALGRDTAVEIRYIGNRNRKAWTTENWNDENIFENGFLNEFIAAQNNLRAHVAQGCGGSANPCSFAYRGAGTGTTPLPTYLAFFSGVNPSQAGDASRYTSGNFTNSDWTGHLSQFEPDPFDAASDLWEGTGAATRRTNALNAGLDANIFVLNPAVDDVNITRAEAGSRYHSLQIDVRRRLSKGFTIQGNYTFAQRWGSSLEDIHRERIYLKTDNLPHAFKFNWLYEVPVGRGKRFGTDIHPILNGIIGNWEFAGTGRVQVRDFGVTGVRLVGMSEKELGDVFEIYQSVNSTGAITYFNLPQDIIQNTRRAFNSDPTSPTGYPAGEEPTGRYIAPASQPGCIFLFTFDCGTSEQIWVRGPWFSRWDLKFKKRFPLGGRATFDLDFEMLNAFNNTNFNPNFNPGSGNTIFQVTSGYTDINTTFDPGGRLGQVVTRFSW
jgi:hypothetical protein